MLKSTPLEANRASYRASKQFLLIHSGNRQLSWDMAHSCRTPSMHVNSPTAAVSGALQCWNCVCVWGTHEDACSMLRATPFMHAPALGLDTLDRLSFTTSCMSSMYTVRTQFLSFSSVPDGIPDKCYPLLS
jgi:hypothetical protein